MPMSIGTKGMQKDYREEAAHTVAMRFPHQKNLLKRSGYQPNFWQFMVMRAFLHPELGTQFIMDSTDEGKAILKGTDISELTQEFLLGLDEDELASFAKMFDVKPSKNPKATAMRILAAREEGAKPNKAASGV